MTSELNTRVQTAMQTSKLKDQSSFSNNDLVSEGDNNHLAILLSKELRAALNEYTQGSIQKYIEVRAYFFTRTDPLARQAACLLPALFSQGKTLIPP